MLASPPRAELCPGTADQQGGPGGPRGPGSYPDPRGQMARRLMSHSAAVTVQGGLGASRTVSTTSGLLSISVMPSLGIPKDLTW